MKYFLCAIALSFGVAYAENVTPGMLNQTHDGANIQGGTYFNTAGSETKFINSAGTGITLNAGQNIRGVEAANGLYTGNGGAIHIQAPDQVVRLNGNIDVRGFFPDSMRDGNAHPDGNGGKVTVDAAYLFQNGNIYASGFNGGNVQFNVGGMTMGSNSRIDASGRTLEDPANLNFSQGDGGQVNIHSTRDVNINQGAFIATNSNLALGSFMASNSGPISITGRAVNMDGILHATNAGIAGPGIITLTATGSDSDLNIGQSAILSAGGGSINLSSNHNINQNGLIVNNGGSFYHYNSQSMGDSWVEYFPGGTVNLTAENAINQAGRIQADGANSANGGVIVVSAPSIINTGVIRANGGQQSWEDGSTAGNGGSVTFIGANPAGTGSVVALGGTGTQNGALGTITAPDPVNSTNQLYGVWKKPAP